MQITLDRLLASRETRSARQRMLQSKYPGQTLLCLTLVMPGNVKRNVQSLVLSQAALTALIDRFSEVLTHIECSDLQTGFEAYLLLSLPLQEAKAAACELEDTHPLGRLFDIDVIGEDGVPLSRLSAGRPQRGCLLCGEDARVCMRKGSHSLEDLQSKIDEMINSYVH